MKRILIVLAAVTGFTLSAKGFAADTCSQSNNSYYSGNACEALYHGNSMAMFGCVREALQLKQGGRTDLDASLYVCGHATNSDAAKQCEIRAIGQFSNPIQAACAAMSPTDIAGCVTNAKNWGAVHHQDPGTDFDLAIVVVCNGYNGTAVTVAPSTSAACEGQVLASRIGPCPKVAH